MMSSSPKGIDIFHMVECKTVFAYKMDFWMMEESLHTIYTFAAASSCRQGIEGPNKPVNISRGQFRRQRLRHIHDTKISVSRRSARG